MIRGGRAPVTDRRDPPTSKTRAGPKGAEGHLQVPPRDCGAAARGGSLTHGASRGFVERFGADHDHRLDPAGRPDRDPRPVPRDDARPARRRRARARRSGWRGCSGRRGRTSGSSTRARRRRGTTSSTPTARSSSTSARQVDGRPSWPTARWRHPRPLGLEPARRHGRVRPRASRARGVVIDHHVSQDDLGAIFLKDTTAEATGTLVMSGRDEPGRDVHPRGRHRPADGDRDGYRLVPPPEHAAPRRSGPRPS